MTGKIPDGAAYLAASAAAFALKTIECNCTEARTAGKLRESGSMPKSLLV
ncbi:hypothetical protein NBRC116594_41830 [Shimia sp. NS0008-38b]